MDTNHVDQTTKHTVYGYLRWMEKDLRPSSDDVLFRNIPELITNICICYYFREKFAIANGDTEISPDGQTTAKTGEGWANTSYGAAVIPSMQDMVYQWDLITSHTKGYAFVGITSNVFDADCSFDEYDNDKGQYSYAYCGWNGNKLDGKLGKQWDNPYGDKYADNDAITIQLDLRKKE